MEFEIDREYAFVRIVAGNAERVIFTRYEDGSADVQGGGRVAIWEIDPEAWRLAIADLEANGWKLEH